MVLILVAGAGLAVGGLVALAARRWPKIEAPAVSEETVVKEVVKHPGLAGHFRHHFNPKTETGVALIAATAVVTAAAVGIGVLFVMIREKFGLQSIDVKLARYGADHAADFSTDMMRHISEFGGTRGVVLLALIATVVEYVRHPSRAIPLFMTIAVGGQFALSNGIKYIVERARPDFNPLTGFAGTSFPSGHATASAATLAAIALIMTRGRRKRTKIAAAGVAAGLAAMVAATRVLLGVHWFTDVCAGLLLGWGWFSLCSIAFGGRLLSFGAPVETAEAVAEVVPPEPTNAGNIAP